MGHNTNWDKFAHFRAPRKAPQYVDMGDFVWVTGGVDGKKNEPSMIYHFYSISVGDKNDVFLN